MFRAAFIQCGVALLAIACLVHAFEHYETVAFEKCLAACDHTDTDPSANPGDSGLSGHPHACTPHEHSPAVMEFSTPFLAGDAVSSLPVSKFPFPPILPCKIELPPRLA